MRSHPRRAVGLVLLGLCLAVPASATWSIVVVNRITGELAVATSTCIANFDIGQYVPVIRVGKAAGAAQSYVTSNAMNRRVIFRNSLRDATPQQMLDVIAATDGGFQLRQFGIVAFAGPPVTHTGTMNGSFANGIVGEIGPYQYAIQGNVLTGNNVILDCEAAFRTTVGDLGEKIVAAMEAGRDAGGDGRCSCNVSSPTSCGSPPPSFNYASYTVFMGIARLGDTDAPCLGSTGCAAGDYYLRLTYAGNNTLLEPIAQLRSDYTAWRASHVGRPDHVLSEVESSVPLLQADGVTTSHVTVQLRDIDGTALTVGGQVLTVWRRGDDVATVTNVVDHGDGTHSFDLVATAVVGEGTYKIWVDDGVRAVHLYPPLVVVSTAPAEMHIGQSAYSVAEGTPLPLIVDRGVVDAGAMYRILGSFSGTQPGTVVGGVLVPLNRDRMFRFSETWAGAEPFVGNAGVLDGGGRAEALFAPPAGALGGMIGSTVSFCALIGGGGVTSVASVLVGP